MNDSAVFSWRTKNQFTLLVDSHDFYPAMLYAIEQAQHYILIEQYLVKTGAVLNTFINALIAASERKVHVLLLLDDYGASEIDSSSLQKLQRDYIHIHFFNPFRWTQLYKSMRRDHRKLLLVDNKQAFVGGAGISDEYTLHTDPQASWHDIAVKIEGEVVNDWQQVFVDTWTKQTGSPPPIQTCKMSLQGKQLGRVLLANGAGKNHIIRHAITHIQKAQKSIWIATPYFITTRKLRRYLKQAAKRGVDVRLLLPSTRSDHPWLTQAARRYYKRLLMAGVKIYEYQPRFIHAKIILCDSWVSIGSSNLDRWNNFWNLDANQTIQDEAITEQTIELFQHDFSQSHHINLAIWRTRPWYQRIQEYWSGYTIRIIEGLMHFMTRMNKKKRVR